MDFRWSEMQSATEDYRSETVKLVSTSYSPPDVSDSPPIIFIHGLCSTNRTWNIVKCDISDKTKRKIYAIDLRNHGKSEWPNEFSMKLFVNDLENFMITENIPKAILVGHSLGGRIAISLAFRKPEMVEKLVVEDICLNDTERSIQATLKTTKFLSSLQKAIKFIPPSLTELEAHKRFQAYLENYFPEIAGNASSSNMSLTLPFYKDKSGNFAWEVDMEACISVGENLNSVSLDLSDDPIYHGEMLLLGAEKSEILTEEDVDIFYKHIPKCKAFFFKGGYHNLHMEFPEKYKEIVTDFIMQ